MTTERSYLDSILSAIIKMQGMSDSALVQVGGKLQNLDDAAYDILEEIDNYDGPKEPK